MQNLFKINKCQVCNQKLIQVLDLGNHPLCDDLIKINSKKKSKEYPIKILYCTNCFTAFQKYQVVKKTLFPKTYHYRAKLTNDVIKGQQDLLNEIKKFSNLKNKKILDIGCNDGALLDLFKKYNSKTIGIEPTNAAKDVSSKHDIYQSFLNLKICRKIKAKYKKIDIITFTNVFAHINNLNEVLECLKFLSSEKTLIVIENHYLGSILKKKQFDTFYHEHPRTYSLKSFYYIAKKIGMTLLNYSFPSRYGGNIRVILSNITNETKINHDKKFKFEKKYLKEFKILKKNIIIWKKNKKNEILAFNKKYGPLPAKAFPGRAAILTKLLGLGLKNISSVYEKNNSKKIGFYLPSTRIPILNDNKLKNLSSKIPIINFAWHIDQEIKNYLKKIKIYNKIITIIRKEDFKV